MIYFDNAATGAVKPDCVYQSTFNAIKYLSVNAGHSSHRLAVKGEEYLYKTRKSLAEFFNAKRVERVIFTKNCTEALNMAILGTVKKGANVVVSPFEHNSVLRPLYHLERQGLISLTVLKPNNNAVFVDDVARALRSDTYLVCLTGASNVTGEINDYEAIGAFLHKNNVLFLLDGAQVAGHAFIDMEAHNIDVFCFAGHKGMHAIQGVGGLIFNKNVEIAPLTFGGSGTESFAPLPSAYPELLESGTQSLPAVISLLEGTEYNKQYLKIKQQKIIELTRTLCGELEKINGIRLFSRPNPVGIVSFSFRDYSSQEVAGVLSDNFDVAVRGGYHCAPLTHQFLNTKANGLVRASVSEFNTDYEIERFISYLKKVPQHLY